MPIPAEECGMGRKTNHSDRKSCVQALRKARVARDKIKHVTGHKSILSIKAYDDKLSDDSLIFSQTIQVEIIPIYQTSEILSFQQFRTNAPLWHCQRKRSSKL